MFRSHDGGDSWEMVPGISNHEHARKWQPGNGGLCMHTIIRDGNRVHLGISTGGHYLSEDGGERLCLGSLLLEAFGLDRLRGGHRRRSACPESLQETQVLLVEISPPGFPVERDQHPDGVPPEEQRNDQDRLGFEPEGDEFMDGGLPHVMMRRRL